MPSATPQVVRAQIAKGKPDPVYLILGDDDACFPGPSRAALGPPQAPGHRELDCGVAAGDGPRPGGRKLNAVDEAQRQRRPPGVGVSESGLSHGGHPDRLLGLPTRVTATQSGGPRPAKRRCSRGLHRECPMIAQERQPAAGSHIEHQILKPAGRQSRTV